MTRESRGESSSVTHRSPRNGSVVMRVDLKGDVSSISKRDSSTGNVVTTVTVVRR